MNNYPYEDVMESMLDAILFCIADISLQCNSIVDINCYSDQKINEKFNFLRLRYRSGNYTRKDPHITATVDGAGRGREAFHRKNLEEHFSGKSRISALIKQNMLEVHKMEQSSRSERLVAFPSPFKILYEILTVPDEPASKAYAFYAVRQYLLTTLHIQLENLRFGYLAEIGEELVDSLTYEKVSDLIENVNNHRARSDAVDYSKDRKNQFAYLMLSLKGLLIPRVVVKKSVIAAKKGKTSVADHTIAKREIARILKNGVKIFSHAENTNPTGQLYSRSAPCKLELVFSPLFTSMPSLAEITNEIWGVPVPIRGADTILSGALKLSADQGLVVGVAGTPGAGKTSFALALATAWAPLGTRTVYLTFEENEHDLSIRQKTIRPEALAKTSYLSELKKREWFHPKKIDLPVAFREMQTDQTKVSRSQVLRQIMNEMKAQRSPTSELEPDSIGESHVRYEPQVPFMFVLDGIQNFQVNEKFLGQSEHADGGYDIFSFIEDCRALKAVVVILSTSKNLELDPMERVVDVSVHMEQRKTLEVFNKPFRAFTLKKTRHQISRPGTSIFHLNSEKGFRISPQLSSQVDKKSHSMQRLAVHHANDSDQLRFEFFRCALNRNGGDSNGETAFADTYPNSNILLHGRGSSGKASLGMKFLFSPMTRKSTDGDGNRELDNSYTPRVLVISFLYADLYYHQLHSKIRRSLINEFSDNGFIVNQKLFKPSLKVIHCHPGYLQPEDLYSKINNELDRSELAGNPYTGVLLDGLHNVFLQFPLLEQHGTIWPMLYASLRTRDMLQVVTTHTTISVGGGIDVEGLYQIREDKPFLIALLQSTDFYFEINRDESTDDVDADYKLRCISAISQKVPKFELAWDKGKCSFSVRKNGNTSKNASKNGNGQKDLFL